MSPQLITNPVLASFLEVKWKGPSWNFTCQLILWLVFSVLLTAYICMAFGGKTLLLSSKNAKYNDSSDVYEFNNAPKATIDGMGIALIVFTSLLFFWEVLQMIRVVI